MGAPKEAVLVKLPPHLGGTPTSSIVIHRLGQWVARGSSEDVPGWETQETQLLLLALLLTFCVALVMSLCSPILKGRSLIAQTTPRDF